MTQNDPSTDLPWEPEGIDLSMPMEVKEAVGTTPMDQQKLMNDDQARRIIALSVARPLLMNKPNAFAGSRGPKPEALIAIADWIITGQQEDPYPYADHEGIVHLGPTITMRPEGYLYVNGDLYVPSQEDPPL